MAKRYETYAYIDLETLAGHRSDDGDCGEPPARVVDAKHSCRGKTLLLWSAKGLEIVQVPPLLH
jgi:hypothetical protein